MPKHKCDWKLDSRRAPLIGKPGYWERSKCRQCGREKADMFEYRMGLNYPVKTETRMLPPQVHRTKRGGRRYGDPMKMGRSRRGM